LADRVVTWQLRHSTSDDLIDRAGDVARSGWVVEATDEAWAFIHARVASIAVVDDLGQGRDIPASEEIAMESVAGRVTIGEDEWLLALTLSPPAGENRGVPVDFVEDVRKMNKSSRAVAVGGELHVVLVVRQAGCLVPARWEVDVGTERRSITITVLVWEPNTCTCVARVLNTHTVKTIRVGRVQRGVGV
jgi:hypothetical protein